MDEILNLGGRIDDALNASLVDRNQRRIDFWASDCDKFRLGPQLVRRRNRDEIERSDGRLIALAEVGFGA